MGGGRSNLGMASLTGGGRRRRSERFQDFGAGSEALHRSTKFYSDHSNSDDWHTNLINSDEYRAINDYTGEGHNSYHDVNHALYTTPYEEMEPGIRKAIDDMTSGINKFVLEKGIQVTRQADFKVFGAESGEKMTMAQIKKFIKENAAEDGTLQQNGFLSSGSNNHGAAVDGSGLVIHFKVPPSIGAGAYVNPISQMGGSHENEWLFNKYSRFKFDTSSMFVDYQGKIHINATWKGLGKKQVLKKKKK